MTEPITRTSVAREAIDDWSGGDHSEGNFSSIGMLITDSLLSRDAEALHALHDGLRRLYGEQLRRGARQMETTGRLLGLIDVTLWALRRVDGPKPPPTIGEVLDSH